jgi:hypothetical protein
VKSASRHTGQKNTRGNEEYNPGFNKQHFGPPFRALHGYGPVSGTVFGHRPNRECPWPVPRDNGCPYPYPLTDTARALNARPRSLAPPTGTDTSGCGIRLRLPGQADRVRTRVLGQADRVRIRTLVRLRVLISLVPYIYPQNPMVRV